MAPGPFDGVIFDLDNTLYSRESGLFPAIDRRISAYVREKLGLSEAEAEVLRRRYRGMYGVTLRGLMVEHCVPPEEFLEYVHRVPVEEFISPDPGLRALLEGIPCPRFIFTNGSREYARRVLRRLSVDELFQGVFDITFTGYVPKPEEAAFRKVLDSLGLAARRVVYVDDLVTNLQAAGRLGMTTILLHRERGAEAGIGHTARGLADLARTLDHLFGIARPGDAPCEIPAGGGSAAESERT